MKLTGMLIVRDEADIVRTALRHHFRLGLDEIIVMDDSSTDGTERILARMAKTHPIRVIPHSGPFAQLDMLNELAREAMKRGADWIIPFDVDEFWHLPGTDLRSLLPMMQDSGIGAIQAQVHNFIQWRGQRDSTPGCLLNMTQRAVKVYADHSEVSLVKERRISFVEAYFPPKWIFRSSPELRMQKGNHLVEGVIGDKVETDHAVVLHAPIRSFHRLIKKAQHAARIKGTFVKPGDSWHTFRWDDIMNENQLEAEWRANSYDEHGLDVYGTPRLVVPDFPLRNVLRPLLRWPWDRR